MKQVKNKIPMLTFCKDKHLKAFSDTYFLWAI